MKNYLLKKVELKKYNKSSSIFCKYLSNHVCMFVCISCIVFVYFILKHIHIKMYII